MTEENFPYPINLHSSCPGPARQNSLVGRSQFSRIPADAFAKRLRHFRGLTSSHRAEHYAVAIASNESDWNLQVEQTLQRLARHRTGEDIAADYDFIRAGVANFLENRLEGRKIPMNVVDRCHSRLHRLTLSFFLDIRRRRILPLSHPIP
ncbi:MAG: hypothetical protein QOG27_1176 [Verrucomicrobiota bacterium]